MRRTRYRYNPVTCRYEPFYIEGKAFWQRASVFLFFSSLLAVGGYFVSVRHFDSLDEMLLNEKNQKLKISWSILHERIQNSRRQLNELIENDDHNYRVILDSNPLPATIREAGIGGSEKVNLKDVRDFPYIVADHISVEKLRHQADVEVQSYDELSSLLDNKLMAWAARPAIQPVSNTQLEKLHLIYGLRLHPIFKVWTDHKGLDFAAPQGTPVYATGDGKVLMAYFSESYGNVIYLDHGYDFESRYAHLVKFVVRPGEQVKRGQLIGYVGNTGNSVAPHLHYEILIKGQPVNPINFFQRDLSTEEYQKLIDVESENSISLD
jgi:murein DD-endopeptidase MepM/ murein hydrolase activator NlpD